MTRSERMHSAGHEVHDRLHAAGQDVQHRLQTAVAEIKPRLRGWLHAVTVPLSFAAGIVLVALAPTDEAKIGGAVFAVTAVLLFAVSALYHTRSWSPRTHGWLKRFDHANIFLLIAGSYTPFALLLLDSTNAKILLAVVWSGALLGVAFRVLWLDAPRWLYVPSYIALGWAAMFWIGDFASGAPTSTLVLIIVGGGLYSLGGLVYGFKKPDPLPAWFGFHEVFHSLTIAAFASHYIGVSIAAYSLR